MVYCDSIPRKQSKTAPGVWRVVAPGTVLSTVPCMGQPITKTCPAPNAHSSKLEKVWRFQTFVGSGGSHESLWVWNEIQGPLADKYLVGTVTQTLACSSWGVREGLWGPQGQLKNFCPKREAGSSSFQGPDGEDTWKPLKSPGCVWEVVGQGVILAPPAPESWTQPV